MAWNQQWRFSQLISLFVTISVLDVESFVPGVDHVTGGQYHYNSNYTPNPAVYPGADAADYLVDRDQIINLRSTPKRKDEVPIFNGLVGVLIVSFFLIQFFRFVKSFGKGNKGKDEFIFSEWEQSVIDAAGKQIYKQDYNRRYEKDKISLLMGKRLYILEHEVKPNLHRANQQALLEKVKEFRDRAYVLQSKFGANITPVIQILQGIIDGKDVEMVPKIDYLASLKHAMANQSHLVQPEDKKFVGESKAAIHKFYLDYTNAQKFRKEIDRWIKVINFPDEKLLAVDVRANLDSIIGDE